MDLRLIALDLDGTTLNSQGKVSPYTKKNIRKSTFKRHSRCHCQWTCIIRHSGGYSEHSRIKIYHYFQRIQYF